jgi:DeoR family deoxyribose operon repressor
MGVISLDKKTARLQQIQALIKQQGSLTIGAVSREMGVSEMTVRRDVKNLEPGLGISIINGVLFYQAPNGARDEEYELSSETDRHSAEKERIGRMAAGMIEPDDIIIIDGGTTTEKMVPHIPESLPLTALCYGYNILFELQKKPNISLIVAGGYYHRGTSMFESASGIELIKQTRANKVFLSCAGAHESLGFTHAQSHETLTVQTAIASSHKKIMLADSSKFGVLRPSFFAQLSDMDVIITDSGISGEWRDILNEAGAELHIV